MQIPGLLVEYLINGSVALFWLIPLMLATNLLPNKLENSTIIVLLVPALYVLGMIIDTLANFIVSLHKDRIRVKVCKRLGVPDMEFQKISGDFSGYFIEAKLILHAPELAKAVEKRSTRDRIARSAIVNAIITTVIFTVLSFNQKGNSPLAFFCLSGGAVIIAFCWAMWSRYQAGSFAYEVAALQILDKKLAHEQASEKPHKSLDTSEPTE